MNTDDLIYTAEQEGHPDWHLRHTGSFRALCGTNVLSAVWNIPFAFFDSIMPFNERLCHRCKTKLKNEVSQ